MSRLLGAAVLIALTLGMCGCGGGGGTSTTPSGPHPSSDNAVVAGQVVEADNVAVPLIGAVVSEPSTGETATTDSGGRFTLSGLPGGSIRINVAVSTTPNYNSLSIIIPTHAHQTTSVVLAVLPVAVGAPTALTVSPQNQTVSRGASVQFSANVFVGTTKVSVQPTWILTGDAVGTIDATGLLRTVASGTAGVTAAVGSLLSGTTVVVTSSVSPNITSVLVSASKASPLPASGGAVTITAAISDPIGILTFDTTTQKGLKFEVYLPDGTVQELSPGNPVAGTLYDGTWRLTYNVPANSNIPDSTGAQAPQTYSIRVAARDQLGNASYSAFYDFVVAGLDVPPAPGN